ncbi:MAG: SDR family NAD(P)-dependent oxidoreductase [Polyangiales bacterium]
MEQLRGRTALITGASRGLGQRIARALAKQNVNVALVARSGEALEQLANELLPLGVRAKPIAYDLSDLSRLDYLLDRAEAAVGPIDILVNNAAIDAMRPFTEESDAEIEQMIRLDLLSPMLLTRKMVTRMLANGSGHVVNVASLAGKVGTAYMVSYAAAKAGLIAFTHSLRAELRDSGVRASVIVPGFIAEDGMFGRRQATHALKVSRLLGTSKPEQVADAVVAALLTDKAEIAVSPSPVRLVSALQQISPDAVAWLQRKTGISRMLRAVAEAERSERAEPQPAAAKPSNQPASVPPRA